MADLLIDQFPGIAPRQESASPGAITPAKQAHNCDLFRGTAKPLKGPAFVDGTPGEHTADFVYYRGEWESGLTRPVEWKFGELELLFYLKNGTWKKRVEGVEADLGITRPPKPVVNPKFIPVPKTQTITNNLSPSTPLAYGEYVYYITFSKMVNGVEVEGPPSLALQADPYYDAVEVPASGLSGPGSTYDPDTDKWWDLRYKDLRSHVVAEPVPPTDPTITHWNLYRSDNGGEARLIGQAPVTNGTGQIDDTLSTNARGRNISENVNTTTEQYRLLYVVTWERNVGGQLDESGPSDPTIVGQKTIGSVIQQPAGVPALATSWSIYRISTSYDPTSNFQLVARLPIGTTSYTDQLPNNALGDALATSTESPEGVPINFDAPAVVFSGLAGPHLGMLFGWKGATLYWSEPGKPDAWPTFYKAEAMADVVNCIPNGSELLVLTKKGLQRGIGSTPTQFYLTQSLSGEPALYQRASVQSEAGIFYLTHAGIAQVSGSQARVISDKVLGPEYFDQYDHTKTFMEYFRGKLYVFLDETTAVVFDTRDGKYTTMDAPYTNSYVDRENGSLVVNEAGTLKALLEGGSGLTFTYQTGDIVLREPEQKQFDRFEFFGSGLLDAYCEIDGVEVVTAHPLDLDGMIRDQEMLVPHGEEGRTGNVTFVGQGEVKEIRIDVVRTQF